MHFILKTLLLAAATLLTHGASADAFPTRQLRIIHGGGAGGNVDIVSRAVAQPLGERLGQSVIVEAKPGAGQAIGMSAVAKAAPDGHTLGMINAGIAVATATSKKLPYDLMGEFTFISMVSTFPFVVMVREDSPYKSMKDLVDAARRTPGKLSYASIGIGTTQHLIGELINSSTGIDLVHAPYTSATGGMVDMLGGRMDVVIDTLTAGSAQIRAGKVRALAVTSAKRWPGFMEVPTLAETLPHFEVTSWTGLAVPTGTPPEIVERLVRESRLVVGTEDFKKQLEAVGSLPFLLSGDDMRNHVGAEVRKWRQVAEKARLELR